MTSRLHKDDVLGEIPRADHAGAGEAQEAASNAPAPKPNAERTRDRPVCPPTYVPFPAGRTAMWVREIANKQQAERERDKWDGCQQRGEENRR